MSYHEYAALSPRGNASLPVTFTFTKTQNAKDCHLSVYPIANAKNLSETWYARHFGEDTTAP